MHVDQKIRSKDAAYATGLNLGSLKNWVSKGKINLFSDGEGWREFSQWDINLLAIFAPLIEHGVPVDQANSLARDIVTRGVDTRSINNVIPTAPQTVWAGQICFVWKQNRSWEACRINAAGGEDISEVMAAKSPKGILIDVPTILDTAREKLKEILED